MVKIECIRVCLTPADAGKLTQKYSFAAFLRQSLTKLFPVQTFSVSEVNQPFLPKCFFSVINVDHVDFEVDSFADFFFPETSQTIVKMLFSISLLANNFHETAIQTIPPPRPHLRLQQAVRHRCGSAATVN